VPKHELRHAAGSTLAAELKHLLSLYFKPAEIARLERLGGRVTIALAPPAPTRLTHGQTVGLRQDDLISELRKQKDSPERIKELLAPLSLAQLRKVGGVLGHPVRTRTRKGEAIAEISRHIHDDEVWRRIVGRQRPDSRPGSLTSG